MIRFECDGQELKLIACDVLANGYINTNSAHFEFCARWSNMVKTAQFSQQVDKTRKTFNVLIDDSDGMALVPNEVKPGQLEISVFGVDPETGERLTTTACAVMIEPSGFVGDGDTPIPPTPDLYAQLLKTIEEEKKSGVTIEDIRAAIAAYMKENPVTITETDPSVPGWAKQPNKPTYTAREVGAADAEETAAALA